MPTAPTWGVVSALTSHFLLSAGVLYNGRINMSSSLKSIGAHAGTLNQSSAMLACEKWKEKMNVRGTLFKVLTAGLTSRFSPPFESLGPSVSSCFLTGLLLVPLLASIPITWTTSSLAITKSERKRETSDRSRNKFGHELNLVDQDMRGKQVQPWITATVL